MIVHHACLGVREKALSDPLLRVRTDIVLPSTSLFLLRNGYIIEKRVADFAKTDQLAGQDLSKLFQDFLANKP